MYGRGRLILLPLLAILLVYMASHGRGTLEVEQVRNANKAESMSTADEEVRARSEEGTVPAEDGEVTPERRLLHGKNKKYEAGGGEGIEVNMTVRIV